LAKVNWRRRRSRLATWTLAAAAATALVVGVLVAVQSKPGTGIEMTCSYGMAPESSDRHGDEPGDKLALVVVGRDGSHIRPGTWVTLAGVTAYPRCKDVDVDQANRHGTNRFRR
jgi:hypothetical protein